MAAADREGKEDGPKHAPRYHNQTTKSLTGGAQGWHLMGSERPLGTGRRAASARAYRLRDGSGAGRQLR